VEGALFGLQKEVVVLYFLQDLIYSLLVYDFIIFRGHNEVVHVDFQPPLCDFFSEDVVHHCLKGCRGIGEAKEHDCWFKESFTCFKGGLPFISLFDSDIVVAPTYIEF
jgi:hypothetical protein